MTFSTMRHVRGLYRYTGGA